MKQRQLPINVVRVKTGRAGQLALAALYGAIQLGSHGGCYDSRWGQAKAAQQNNAQHYSGAALGQSEAPPLRLPPRNATLRRFRVVVFATPAHAAEVVNWQARFSEAVQRSNQVLGPALGMQLDVEIGGPWRPRASADHLAPLLEELEHTHDAPDGVWIVGLVGSLSRLESSFHELGMSHRHGQYMVLRAANDALDFDFIERSFAELDAQQRAELYRSRRAHQASAVLLHELGHCLGAEHVTTPTDLMHASYSPDMTGFGEAVVAVLRARVAELALPPAERHAETAERHTERASASVAARTALADPALAALSPADQALYQQLRANQAAGHFAEAWAAGQPLFQAHSELPPIAELRCRLAMDQRLDWQQVQSECAPFTGRSSSGARQAAP